MTYQVTGISMGGNKNVTKRKAQVKGFGRKRRQ
jgi:hypothetical protein